MPSNGGSLTNMWGRASAKPKPPSTTNSTAVAVTEVVWEGEASTDDKAEKNVNTTAATASRAILPSKPKPAANTDKSKAPSKTAAGNKKPAKAGTKQGSIVSFFKKV